MSKEGWSRFTMGKPTETNDTSWWEFTDPTLTAKEPAWDQTMSSACG